MIRAYAHQIFWFHSIDRSEDYVTLNDINGVDMMLVQMCFVKIAHILTLKYSISKQ